MVLYEKNITNFPPREGWKNDLQNLNDILASEKGFWTSKMGTALGICTEAGELADIVRKLEGDKKVKASDDLSNLEESLKYEIADVMVYLFQLATLYKVDIDEALHEKIQIIYGRTFKS